MGRHVAGLPQCLVVVDSGLIPFDAVRIQQVVRPVAGVVPRQRQHRDRDVGPPVGDAEIAEVDVSATGGTCPLAGDRRRRRSTCSERMRRRGRPRAGQTTPHRSPRAAGRTDSPAPVAGRAASAGPRRSPARPCVVRPPTADPRPTALPSRRCATSRHPRPGPAAPGRRPPPTAAVRPRQPRAAPTSSARPSRTPAQDPIRLER